MRFFISGEIHVSIADEWREARLAVEDRLNAYCASREYGTAVTKIAIIPIILPPDWPQARPERRLFQRKNSSADYRTTIDYIAFKSADQPGRLKLLEANILHAVRDLARKAGRAFFAERLAEDIQTALARAVSEPGG